MAGSKVRKNNRDLSSLTQRKTKKQAAAVKKENEIKEDAVENFQEYKDRIEKIIKHTQLDTTKKIKFLVNCLFFVRVVLSPMLAYTHHHEEVFSFIEPLNYSLRIFGKQIDQYAPKYAVNSWFILLPFHSILTCFNILLKSKYIPIWILYYIVKVVLGYLLFKVENSLAVQLGTLFYGNICKVYLFLTIFSVGLFNAGSEGVSYTFALIFLTYSLSTFFKCCLYEIWTETKVTTFSKVSLFIVMAAIFGSPYLILLILPMLLFLVVEYRSLIKKNPDTEAHYNTIFSKTLAKTLKYGAVTVGIVGFMDSRLYSQNCYPLVNVLTFHINTYLKDILSNNSKETTIIYYLSSLILSFPLVVLLGCITAFMFLIQWNVLQIIWPILFQLVMWVSMCLVLKLKSTLYLYPIYTHITLIASFSISYIDQTLKNYLGKSSKIFKLIKYVTLGITVTSFGARIYADYVHNSGSIQVFKKIYSLPKNKELNVLCVSNEYTSYPGAFFLPDNFRLSLVEGDYEISIPKDFPEEFQQQKINNWMDGIKISSSSEGYEEENIESIDSCDYYVESNANSKHLAKMKKVACSLVVDDEKTSLISKYFAFPYSNEFFQQTGLKNYYYTEYKEYCLYEQSN